MKLHLTAIAVGLFAFCSPAQADDFEPSPVGPDVAAALAYNDARPLDHGIYRAAGSIALGETIRRPLSFRRNPLLTLAEREALALRRAAERETPAAQ